MKSSGVLHFIKRKFSERLKPDEIEFYRNILLVSKLDKFKSDFKEIKRIPMRFYFLNDQSIRLFISDEKLISAVPLLLEEHNRIEEQKIKEEEERKRKAEEAERNKSYYNFWNYRGTVYGASKYKKRIGDTVYPVTEFFLKRKQGADEQIVMTGYDMPIANGQDVCVIYACKSGENRGDFIQYINVSMNQATNIADKQQKLITKVFGFGGDNGRLEFELNRYKTRL